MCIRDSCGSPSSAERISGPPGKQRPKARRPGSSQPRPLAGGSRAGGCEHQWTPGPDGSRVQLTATPDQCHMTAPTAWQFPVSRAPGRPVAKEPGQLLQVSFSVSTPLEGTLPVRLAPDSQVTAPAASLRGYFCLLYTSDA